MSIYEKLKEVKDDILIIAIICLAATLGYGAGLVGKAQGSQGAALITSFQAPKQAATETARQPTPEAVGNGRQVYASKNGKRYYYPNCSGLNRIKPENKISFPNSSAAEAKGLTLASGCRP